MSIRSFLENKLDWAKEEKVSLRPCTQVGTGGLVGETTERRHRGEESGLEASCASAAVRFASGSGDHEAVDQANCMFQPGCVCHLPPLPLGSRLLRRPLFLSVCQESGDTCGDRCTIWQEGADSREGGIKCLVPEGPPPQAGEQLSLFLPSLRVSLLRYYRGIPQAA